MLFLFYLKLYFHHVLDQKLVPGYVDGIWDWESLVLGIVMGEDLCWRSESFSSSFLQPHDALLLLLTLPDESDFVKDFFNLSTNLVWNLFNEFVDPLLGGLEPIDLLGDCKLLWLVLEDVREKPRPPCDIFTGTDLWAGDPTMKSLPGDVDKLGHSDLHSDTFLLLHDWPFEHSELRLERFDL